ncbi:MAG TPA: zf-HC2 domain-containing protein [Anaerovoracaceae bacterium]|nr:zf-HC2 domain-containing protein [Anaerovoracaceae bacterium]
MKCKKVRELLSLYIDNMLDEGETKEVEEHLSACGDCEKEYNEIKEVLDLLAQAELVPVPEAFNFRLKNALKEEKRNMIEAGILGKPSKKNRWRIITSVAAVFAVGVVSFALYNDILGVLPNQLAANDQTGAAQPEAADDIYGGKAGIANGAADSNEDTDVAGNNKLDAQIKALTEEAERMTDEIRAQGDSSAAPEEQAQGLKPMSKASGTADSGSTESAKAKERASENAASAPRESPAAGPETAPAPDAIQKPATEGEAANGADAVPFTYDTSRSLTSSGVERQASLEEYYNDLLKDKLKDFDYQILSTEYTADGQWQFRVFIFYGKDGNTYNEEILIIGKDGKLETIYSNEFMGL